MKTFNYLKQFTVFCLIFVIAATISVVAQESSFSTDRGNGWTEQEKPLLLNLNFQDYDHFYSQPDPNSGNSRNAIDADKDVEDPDFFIPGFLDFSREVNYIGSDLTATLDFYQCAFAPDWSTAYAYRDEDGSNTENVSDGFVELSRNFSHGGVPNLQGYFTIDLSNLAYIAALQYTVSSSGGDRRGFSLEYTLDGGGSWDTLRWQPGDNLWDKSFTANINSNERTPNGYRCDGSAYGLVWEEVLDFQAQENDHFMVRFTIASNQVHRVHDFKVYGNIDLSNSLEESGINALRVFKSGDVIKVSKIANVSVFNLSGTLVKHSDNVNSLSVSGLTAGIYIVKADSGNESTVSKIFK